MLAGQHCFCAGSVSNAANAPELPRGRNHRKQSSLLCSVNSKFKSDLLNESESFEMPISDPGGGNVLFIFMYEMRPLGTAIERAVRSGPG